MKDVTAKEQARQFLSAQLKPGDTINCILRHVSRSGMMRHISLLKGENEISYLVAPLLDYKRDKNDGGIKTSGCGMDMGFDLVYQLGHALYLKGFQCSGENCQGNSHMNDNVPRDGKMWHDDGGYAFKHNWL